MHVRSYAKVGKGPGSHVFARAKEGKGPGLRLHSLAKVGKFLGVHVNRGRVTPCWPRPSFIAPRVVGIVPRTAGAWPIGSCRRQIHG